MLIEKRDIQSRAHHVHTVKIEDVVWLVFLVCLLDLCQDLCVVGHSTGRRHQAGRVNEAHTDAIDGPFQHLHLQHRAVVQEENAASKAM